MVNKIIENRKEFYKDIKGAYSKQEYTQLIKAHYKTLKKYMSQFGNYLDYYRGYSIVNKLKLYILLGRQRTKNIIKNGNVQINEIYKLFKWLSLKKDFTVYLFNKTHFSYSINKSDIKIKKKWTFKDDIIYKHKMKFAEFIYLILAEYIILHNYMAVGNLKLKEIRSIDKWLKRIN